ncbi:MAG TPA: Asp-tRNA(Asn)/Glu-tRNA(Gln) amidotransferase subunit GatC [Nitrospiria bacterium]|nr:Asp-tRNA(Asn)/Glu-tRNA(Gln) amidotransferase subunit GatC [Nitrospiria bacterium]
MAISKEEVEHVAKLARLLVSEEEKDVLTRQLSGILTYVGKLNEINTEGVEPLSHVIDIKNVFREDKTRESLSQDLALSNAPEKRDGFFRVPKIIE